VTYETKMVDEYLRSSPIVITGELVGESPKHTHRYSIEGNEISPKRARLHKSNTSNTPSRLTEVLNDIESGKSDGEQLI